MSTVQQFNGSTSPDVVISVEGLWKQYRYGTISHATLRKDIQSWWARIRGKDDPNLPIGMEQSAKSKASDSMPSAPGTMLSGDDRFWALQDVSFEVKQGEVIGIIGKNGAGKSTLLKILSRVTTPTKGEIKIKGRVASLLEVGTGFHPELTGGENIFLNGAILGMTKEEIKRKFDEIVAFAEVAKFVDTPVKRYSSGMYVRLAFAVAAHLEPEILVVDEVLAVGDAQFQKKCLGKMADVAKAGRTVLFVSHNMGAVSALCATGILLQEGVIAYSGSATQVVTKYLEYGIEKTGVKTWNSGVGDDSLRLHTVRLLNSNNNVTNTFDIKDNITIEMEFEVLRAVEGARVGFRLLTSDGTIVLTSEDTDSCSSLSIKEPGLYQTKAIIPGNLLNEGGYSLTFGCHLPMVRTIYFEENCLGLTIENTGGVGGFVDDKRRGIIRPRLSWEYELMEEK